MKLLIHRVWIIIIIFIVLSSIALIHANDAPLLSVGKSVRPRDDVPVRMISEKVSITIGGYRARVDCIFYLRNEGAPDTIDVGFPRTWEIEELYNFRASADSKPLTVKTISIDSKSDVSSSKRFPPVEWKMFKVPFDSTGQVVEVRNSYWTLLQPEGMNRFGDLLFSYVITTGAYWKGDIDSAEISISLYMPFDRITSISPYGYKKRRKYDVTWNFNNFEPTENIRISIMQDFLYERLTIAKKLLEDDPDNAHAHFLLGTVLFNKKFPSGEDAEQEFLKAISLYPQHWDARWYLAAHYFNNKMIKQAEHHLETLVKGNPDYQFEVRGMMLNDVLHEWRLSITGNK